MKITLVSIEFLTFRLMCLLVRKHASRVTALTLSLFKFIRREKKMIGQGSLSVTKYRHVDK